MPHMERKRSESGFYHVVVKGDGGQIIFESDADRKRYIEELSSALDGRKIRIHAYCLMDNHVHLLLEDCAADLSSFMKQLNERYAMYYSKATGRVGHVFQGRFWSEVVNDDEYFLSALRYIHCNPEPPGICKARDYPWSSYREYVYGPRFVETGLALTMLGGVPEFEAFHSAGACSVKPFATSRLCRHLTYDELQRVAVNLLGRDTLNSLKTLEPALRKPYLDKLIESGYTITQIARITGIGQTTIHRQLNA